MSKKSCVIYDSWGELIYNLPNDMAGLLIKEIISYAFDMEPMTDVDPAINAMFAMIKTKMDDDMRSYQAKVERLKANSERNRNDIGTKSKRNRNEVSGVSVSESVSESDSVSVNDSEKDKKHIYGEYKHVKLTDKERDQLFNDYGEADTLKAIKYLDEYIEMKGTKYKSHNLALRKWVFDAIKQTRGQPKVVNLAEKWGLTDDD